MQSSGFIHQSASPFHSSATQNRQAAYYSLATAGNCIWSAGKLDLAPTYYFQAFGFLGLLFFVVVVPFLSPLLILHSVDSLDDVLFLALSLFFTTRLQ